ncbi:MAG: phosphoribosylformylglycinamidine cyclo-ligase [Blastopirellula sp.]|nr:phosphoribosylformylglycinamidine cyclo-ligase [Blastopirellula sp.]
MAKATYKDSGVDLELYRDSMSRLPRLMHRTFSPRVMKLDGGFAGLFQLDFANSLFKRNYEDPVLVSGTDGVGTKLQVAKLTSIHNTVGIDLVAMCVNDIICCGAEPLFFLDYIAMSHDDPPTLEQIVEGVSEGCLQGDCSLLGGETAIMSGMYEHGDYDMAGFCVGVVERKHVLTGQSIAPGDVMLGLASSGLHSNGFSLVRKVVFDMEGLGVDDEIEQLGSTVGKALMTPTRIYARTVRQVLNHYRVKNPVHGIAHITGGGLEENIERILPSTVNAVIDSTTWPVPDVFRWLQSRGGIAQDEMNRVFNMGIGMVLIVSPYFADSIARIVSDAGEACYRIGEIQEGAGKVVLNS